MKRIKYLLFTACLSGIGLTTTAQTLCDDFTTEPWPTEFTAFNPGDTLGFTQDGTQPVIVSSEDYVFMAMAGPDPGIYMVGQVDFEFDGSNQSAQFEIYGFEGQYNEMGFAVNGSAIEYMDATFPLTIGGVTVDLDDSAPDFDSWDNAYLTFTGNLDEVTIVGFESGVLSLCVEDEVDTEAPCDDFTMEPWPTEFTTFNPNDTLGFTQGGTQPVIVSSEDYVYMAMGGPDPGIYMVGEVDFEFDGSNQSAQFEVYGFEEQYYEMGFAVNGSPIEYMDATFPLTIGGLTVDLDDSAPDFDSWDNAYLTFTGNLDEVTIVGFESGVLSLCVEDVVDTEVPCDDFMGSSWPSEPAVFLEGEIVGYTQGGSQPVTVGASGNVYVGDAYGPGLYVFGPVNFAFDGSSQSAQFEIYGFEGQYNEMGFAVNGSAIEYMDATFPLTIDDVTIDLDDSAPDFSTWDNAYLTFTGNLSEVTIVGFESGIKSLCVEDYTPSVDGIEENSIETSLVYPNPATNQVQFFNAAGIHQLTIHSLAGQLITQQQTVGATQTQLDVTELERGIYLVQIELQNGLTETVKLVLN